MDQRIANLPVTNRAKMRISAFTLAIQQLTGATSLDYGKSTTNDSASKSIQVEVRPQNKVALALLNKTAEDYGGKAFMDPQGDGTQAVCFVFDIAALERPIQLNRKFFGWLTSAGFLAVAAALFANFQHWDAVPWSWFVRTAA